MKVIFTMVVLLSFCLCTFNSYTENRNQERKFLCSIKIATFSIPKKGTLSFNFFQINGKENDVSINSTAKTAQEIKTITHTIDIKGERNSLNIYQNGQNGNVDTQLNANSINNQNQKTKAERNSLP